MGADSCRQETRFGVFLCFAESAFKQTGAKSSLDFKNRGSGLMDCRFLTASCEEGKEKV